ncbi:MAG: hypothetical protein AB8G95_04255 [Anaerolineae bacterium]
MNQNLASAINDFQRARRKGTLELLLARLTGRSADLLSYDEVRRAVSPVNQSEKGLQDVPLNAIVGSLGRYKDFTHSFMPINESDQHRWAGVSLAAEQGRGLPPVELYKIDEAYFVKDGNHRVSIARDMNLPSIQAYVTEIETRVPFTPNMNADDLILAGQQVEFLEETKLDELRPESNVRVTEPGKYPILLDHIRTHQYYMGIDKDREIEWSEAVAHWYDKVYLNVIQLVRSRGILDAFPDRTETDFYVWLADHRKELEKEVGWDLPTEAAVESLAQKSLAANVLDLVGGWSGPVAQIPQLNQFSDSTDPTLSPTSKQLISDILVVLGPEIDNQTMLAQALEVAKHEDATLRAIYTSADLNGTRDVVPTKIQELHTEIVSEGNVDSRIAADVDAWDVAALERARWNNLIVAPIYSTGKQKIFDAQWQQRWRNLLLNSPLPVLAVTDRPFAPEKGLLVYTGHQKDQQALFVSTWLASQWGMSLTVGIGGDPSERNALINHVSSYLDRYDVKAEFEPRHIDKPAEILQVTKQGNHQLVIASMRRSVWSRFSPSAHLHVIDLLRDTNVPILILN